jgi:tRNA (guanine-N7-)-methyltransferase
MRFRSSRGGWVPPPAPRLVVPGRELLGPDGWTELFGREAPLVVEIGFGKDTFLLEQAEAHPERDHVGVERDPHRVSAFLRRAERRGLDNVRALPVAGELALGVCFADASIDELHVYFPDPWPKARHARNRLVQPWFAREVRRVLAAQGVLYLATDDAPYRNQMREVMEVGGFDNLLAADWVDQAPLGHETKFERLWREHGREIHHMLYRPRPGTARPAAAPSG